MDRWLQVKQILNQLDEVSKERRLVLLLELVGSDDELRREVEGYLEMEDDADTFLSNPLWNVLGDSSERNGSDGKDSDDQGSNNRFLSTYETRSGELLASRTSPERFPGLFEEAEDVTRIGPYRLQGLLGQGGMAQVHLAVREDDYQQEVALKRVLGPVDRPQLRERFVNERQILANLQHPGIARLLDGGTDEKGFPFLVMEYVEGEPIDAYCHDHGLNLRQRLRLFCQVCRAVHHAHQNLVVHRDLKPSNILVTAEGQVRLLDFGIAKLLAGDEDHQLTAEGQAPMTPAYASPEQMLGEPVTTASDVYSLGVLLYGLLTESKPYDLEGRNFAALARKVCFDDPPLPSQRVTGGDETEGEDRTRRRLSRMLEGDLDAIIMKAMRKEPGRRYHSAAELESDIDHYLEGSPVQAHDGNWLYHTGKFLRRNRPAVAILALIVISAITSMALWQRAELRRGEAEVAQRQAEASRDEAQSLTDFLTQMLRSADPEQSRGADLTVREVVDVARDDVESVLVDRPKTQATMYSTLSGVYDSLGLYEEGLELSEKALEKEIAHTPEITYALTLRFNELGRSYYNIGDMAGAERNFQRALELRRDGIVIETHEIEPFKLATLIFNLASVKNSLGKYDEAMALHREALNLRLTRTDVDPSAVGSSYYGLGAILLSSGAYVDAEPLLDKALEIRRQVYGTENRLVADVLAAMGEVHLATERVESAEALFSESLQIRTDLLGPNHPSVGASHKLLALALIAMGDTGKAELEIQAALNILQGILPEDRAYWGLADARSVLGVLRLNQGRSKEGRRLLIQSHAELETHLGAENHRTRNARRRLLEAEGTTQQDPSAPKAP